MSKCNFIRLAIAAAAMAVASISFAATSISGSDGCAILRQIISSQFGTISMPGTDDRFEVASRSLSVAPDTPLFCASTAASVSRAFSAAMHGAGIPVTWGGTIPVEYCMDRYLPQCYPIIGPVGTTAMAQERSYVHDAWKAVTRSVMEAMPYGVGSDMAVFDQAGFARSIANSLRYELGSNTDSTGRAPR